MIYPTEFHYLVQQQWFWLEREWVSLKHCLLPKRWHHTQWNHIYCCIKANKYCYLLWGWKLHGGGNFQVISFSWKIKSSFPSSLDIIRKLQTNIQAISSSISSKFICSYYKTVRILCCLLDFEFLWEYKDPWFILVVWQERLFISNYYYCPRFPIILYVPSFVTNLFRVLSVYAGMVEDSGGKLKMRGCVTRYGCVFLWRKCIGVK